MIGHIISSGLTFLLTGLLIMVFDIRIYNKEDMRKEKKTALIFGISNATTGILLLVLNFFLKLD